MNQSPTTGFSVCDADREAIRNIRIVELEPAEEDQDEPGGISGAIRPDGLPMSESEFSEFWSVGVWDMIAQAGDLPVIDRDLSPVMVPQEKQERAMKAGAALYRLTDRYPRALGWMKSPMAAATGEMGACAMFFGAQIMTLAVCMRQPPRSAHQQQEAPDERG